MSILMSRKEMASWEPHRRRGRLRFVLLHGVVLWGSFTVFMWMALTWFRAGPEHVAITFFSRPLTLLLAVVLGGLLFGFLLWEFNEIRYKHSLEDGRAPE